MVVVVVVVVVLAAAAVMVMVVIIVVAVAAVVVVEGIKAGCLGNARAPQFELRGRGRGGIECAPRDQSKGLEPPVGKCR